MKLYAFITPDIPKNAEYLKIGETNGCVEKRIKEQGHTHNSRSIEVWRDSIVTEQRRIDKRIHAYLREQGFDNPKYPDTGEYTELVKCSVDDLKKAFEVIKQQVYQEEKQREEVGKKFYLEIRNWFYWASAVAPSPDCTLRIIVRTLLCFFFQDKGLVAKEFFDENWLNEHLKADPNRFYNGILRNLFFHCLNTPMKGRAKFEHSQLFKSGSKVKELLQKVPLLNGGLFNEHEGDHVPLSDGYFFSPTLMLILPELDDKKPYPVEGLINILSKYKYKLTLDDLIDRAEYLQTIDPEFLGKVFESLLACIDADSKETRRKTTGSYYTPVEIVEYMVNEALDALLEQKVGSRPPGGCVAEGDRESACDPLSPTANVAARRSATYHTDENLLLQCKILDPACGSGAFSCGIMNELMRRIDPDKEQSQSERYRKKLEILQKVIYGVDIQQMAVQIAVLRLFLSLIQEIIPDKKKDNYGIEPLPNLETKFVCANTLIGLKQSEQKRLELPIIKSVVKQLQATRNQYLVASNPAEKARLRDFDTSLRSTLSVALEEAGSLSHDIGEKLASWNPYDQSLSADFFEPYYMFGVEAFDIVIGNPPWGARYSAEYKEYFKKHYKSAKTTKDIYGTYKGSLDTFSLFIEKGHQLCKVSGILHYIVPMSVISSDSMAGLHRLLEKSCSVIKVSSYAVRPQPVFENSVADVSILFFTKDEKENKKILATRMYRKRKEVSLKHMVNNLDFVEVQDLKLPGRYPKISFDIERSVLKKIFSQSKKVKNYFDPKGTPIFYRVSGGRYFKIITNYTTDSTKEKAIYFAPKIANSIGAVLSSNLFWYYLQVYANNHDLKTYEIESFRLPILSDKTVKQLEKVYSDYLADIEKNACVRKTERYANIDSFREYKIGKSKHLIDKIDDIICPLYGLTQEETEFIKNYELQFRIDEEEVL